MVKMKLNVLCTIYRSIFEFNGQWGSLTLRYPPIFACFARHQKRMPRFFKNGSPRCEIIGGIYRRTRQSVETFSRFCLRFSHIFLFVIFFIQHYVYWFCINCHSQIITNIYFSCFFYKTNWHWIRPKSYLRLEYWRDLDVWERSERSFLFLKMHLKSLGLLREWLTEKHSSSSL